MTETKKVFFALPMVKRAGPFNTYANRLWHAGTAIAAVEATGQKVFSEVRVTEGLVFTDYYTLNPEGI